jgi:CheY-like chemotaxis protein
LAEQVRKILIVEDEPDNREIMRAVVEDILGHRALLVADGNAALDVIGARSPSMILMDLMMPIVDGFEVIRTLKTDGRTAHIPIIAVSGLSRPADREHAMEMGADDFIMKPFDLEQLIEVIEQRT